MKRYPYLDEEEKEIIEAYERGEFVRLNPKEEKAMMAALRKAAKAHLKKSARVNIRISETDLRHLKLKAAEEGIPYQTLISSVLHKYLNGRLS